MVKSVNSIFGAMLVSAVALITPSVVSAEPIALTFDEQGFTITGELIGLTEVGYMIMTEAGEYTIPFNYVSCKGADCPATEQATSADS